VSVSQDALSLDRAGDKLTGNLTGPSNQETFYAARIVLATTQIQIDDKLVNLGPGMAVTAEIKTGRRRLIEYVISPLLRYKQDALRER
jgi:hemolysin D